MVSTIVYDDILVPTDGSESSMAAVDQATAIAEGRATTVHFLHVIDVGTEMSAGASGSIAPQLTETLEEEAESALDDAANRAEEAGISYDRNTREGSPHEGSRRTSPNAISTSLSWGRAVGPG
nr:universal stress protein [Haloterrigena gelatinilytica]